MKIGRWNILTAAGLAALVAIGTAGCSSTSGVVTGGRIDDPEPYIVINNRSLANQLSVKSFEYDRKGDLPRAFATLLSNRNRSLEVMYRFQWYDGNGVEIDPGKKPYRTLIVEGKEGVSVTSLAPSPAAVEAKMNVKKIKVIRFENIIP